MEYRVSELAKEAGVTKRTIHYYISKGLLMPPDGEGVNSTYSEKHLERIKKIKELQKNDMPLNKIRDNLNGKTTTKVKTVESTSTKTYIREDVCGIFEMDYLVENAEKYAHIIDNVKKYVKKMMED